MSVEANPPIDPYYFNNPDLLTTLGALGGNYLRILSVTALASCSGETSPETIYRGITDIAPPDDKQSKFFNAEAVARECSNFGKITNWLSTDAPILTWQKIALDPLIKQQVLQVGDHLMRWTLNNQREVNDFLGRQSDLKNPRTATFRFGLFRILLEATDENIITKPMLEDVYGFPRHQILKALESLDPFNVIGRGHPDESRLREVTLHSFPNYYRERGFKAGALETRYLLQAFRTLVHAGEEPLTIKAEELLQRVSSVCPDAYIDEVWEHLRVHLNRDTLSFIKDANPDRQWPDLYIQKLAYPAVNSLVNGLVKMDRDSKATERSEKNVAKIFSTASWLRRLVQKSVAQRQQAPHRASAFGK